MRFTEMLYEKPDIQEMAEKFSLLIEKFESSTSAEKQDEVLEEIQRLRMDYNSRQSLVYIRHSMNTEDEFYKEQQAYFDQNGPIMEGMINKYYQKLINSPFRRELELKWGKQLFRIAENSVKTFDESIIPYLQKENQLITSYQQLMAAANIEFQGQILNLSQLGPYVQSTNRETRKDAQESLWNYFLEREEDLNNIYDELVHVRHEMARKLGYPSFVELAYARLNRTDYDAAMVARFRRQVKQEIVPIASRLREEQRNRLQLENLRYYDESLTFANGNPHPHGNADWIIAQAAQMYEELSPETGQFFRNMQENELMDLLAQKGKAVGGYCTVIPKYEAPFIFANFNGTYHDVTVLTHEAGHAFQSYMSRKLPVPEYLFPTLEACEIHSMSMEFITWPWMDNFFAEDADKFRYKHLSEALTFIPYGVAVDEFQHQIYSEPNLSPRERKEIWSNIEKEYLPHRDYENNPFLEAGGYWQHQTHIYTNPFYYIDYTLAQVCAFQFWKKRQENPEEAWKDYLRICRVGGSRSFLDIVREGRLMSPFQEGAVASVTAPITRWLDSVDASRF
ncbi:M3 family oligoendopeptidase [Alicyclobacillus sp. TC]|uniref:M3 family oligoendopeptidase n=1 Tax=Alicyclobacillus sp. TC TaxID=2606450 RepID=UPI0019343AF3|nr:M3 family oligoendopeptidase [Alicyclobacillus sp. TC]QRF24812.1 M3 family oligoendopeptidase [Alicyclobacillus sp. TC]